jgi:hypothetical protein
MPCHEDDGWKSLAEYEQFSGSQSFSLTALSTLFVIPAGDVIEYLR